MATDTTVPGSSTAAPKTPMGVAVTQAKNRYEQLSRKQNRTEADVIELLSAQIEVLTLGFQEAGIDGQTDSAKALVKLGPELLEQLKKARATFAAKAADENLNLNKELTQKQWGFIEKQSKDLFDLDVAGQRSTVSLLGTARGIASLLKAFGVDTTEFIASCDTGIKEAKSHIPDLDIKKLETVNRVMDTKVGDNQMHKAEGYITADMQSVMKNFTNDFEKYLERLSLNKDAPAGQKQTAKTNYAPTAGQTTYSTVDAVAALSKDGLGITSADQKKLKGVIEKIAALDGNATSFSPAELIELNKKMLVVTESQTATDKIMAEIKKHPETTPVAQAKTNIAAPALEFNK